MRHSVLIVILACAFTGGALAQSFPTVPRSAVVPIGVKREIGFFTSLNPDCSTNGEIQSRLIKPPAHGTVELDDGPGYPAYALFNQRYACNNRPVMGVRVYYTSKDGYVGKDAFEVEFFAPAGQEVTWKWSVTVK